MTELFLEVVNRSISAGYLVILLVLLRLGFKRMPKWVAVLLWGFVGFRLVCPVDFQSSFSLIPSAQTVSPEIMLSPVPQVQTGLSSVDAVVNPVVGELFTPDPVASANPLQILIPVLGQLWLVGMAAMAVYTMVSYLRLRRQVAGGVKLRENIYQSEAVATPFLLGLFRPRIYLPFGISQEEMECVIAHEKMHLRRHDHWWKPLGFALLSLTWFHPLMWCAYILLCRDIELACDEAAVKSMDALQRAAYSQTLLDLSIPRRQLAACPLAFGELGVRERVRRVLCYKKPAFWLVILCLVLCAAVAVTFLTSPSDKGLEMLHSLKEEEISVIYSSSASDVSEGTTFYSSDDNNLARILPALNQAKGTPVSKPWGAKKDARVQFITIFLESDLWASRGKLLSVEIVGDKYLVVEDYWYEADSTWLETIPKDKGHHRWRKGLSMDVVERVEFTAKPGSGVQQADTQRLINALNRMDIPAIGYPDTLLPVQATYKITTFDGAAHTLAILGSQYLMIDDVLYDVGSDWLRDLTAPANPLNQLPLPDNLTAAVLRIGSGQTLALINDPEILNQLIDLLNQGKLQSQEGVQMETRAVLVLHWPNGDMCNLLISSNGPYFQLGDSIYSYGSFSADDQMKNREELWQLFGFGLPVDNYQDMYQELVAPGYLSNDLFEEVVVMPEGTLVVGAQEFKTAERWQPEQDYALFQKDGRYHLRLLQDSGTREMTYQKLQAVPYEDGVCWVLTNSIFGISDIQDIQYGEYLLIPEE